MSGSTTTNRRVRKRTVSFSFARTALTATTARTADQQPFSFFLLVASAVPVDKTTDKLPGQKKLPPAVVGAIGTTLQSERAARGNDDGGAWQRLPKATSCRHRCFAKAACRHEAHPNTNNSTARMCGVTQLQQQQRPNQ